MKSERDNSGVIARIEEKLREYPDVLYRKSDNRLEVPAQSPTGFCVWILDRPDKYTVGFEGWHEEFEDADEALDCFTFGLSNACLLRIFRRGETDYKWLVLQRENGEWVSDSETGLLLFPFWRRCVQRDLQNDILKRGGRSGSSL
jgi:hypothetical protein